MTTPSWPTDTINYLAERGSWNQTPNEPVLRSEFDYGPARSRRRFTKQISQITFRIVMTNQQFAYFEAFYQNDIHSGAAWFTMPVYLGRGTYEEKRVRITEPPTHTEALYGHVTVSLKLELSNSAIVSSATVWLLDFFGESSLLNVSGILDEAVNVQYPNATLGV